MQHDSGPKTVQVRDFTLYKSSIY